MTKPLPLLSLLAVCLGAGAAPAAEPLRVVTSIETFADLARRMGGEEVVVESLSHGYQDPHFVEAKPNLMVVLNRADLLVRVGLDLEIGWLPLLVQGARNARIQPGQPGDLDVSTLIEVQDVPQVKVTRALGDVHPAGNPHYWIPPVNAVRIARGLAERLKQLRPASAPAFEARFQQFLAELKTRAPAWEARARPLAGQKIVTYHRSWVYVSRWLKLEEVGYVENKPGVPPSPDHLAELIVLMRAQGVKRLLMESFHNRSVAETVAREAGATLLALPSDVGARPEVKGYFELVDAVLGQLAE
jgi:zinc/manganese transport system substrate-binding protein